MVVAFASWSSGGLVSKRIKTGLLVCCAHALSSLFIVLFLIVSCCRKNAKYQSCRNDTNLEKINNIHCAFVSLQECRECMRMQNSWHRGQRHSEFFFSQFRFTSLCDSYFVFLIAFYSYHYTLKRCLFSCTYRSQATHNTGFCFIFVTRSPLHQLAKATTILVRLPALYKGSFEYKQGSYTPNWM